MKIVVCVKHVPDAAADRTFDDSDHTVDRAGVDGLLSELDEYAVEQALTIAEAADDAEVTVLSIGPERATDAIRKALQMGADKGVHVSDEAIHGSDAIATSLILAKAIEKLDYDIVLCGMASTDGEMGVVPAMLAERLGIAQGTLGSELAVEGSTVRIRRDGDVSTETVEASTPAVVSVTDQTPEARYPSFKGIMAAKKKPVESWTLSDLDVAPDQVGLAAAWSSVSATQVRPPRTKGQIVPDEGEGGVKLVEFLAAQKFV